MRRTTPALVVAAGLAAASLSFDAAAQTGGASQPSTSGSLEVALDKAGISQKDFDTYKQVREELMANPNVAPMLRQSEDLQSQALDRYLQRERTGMSSEEFVSIHRIVQNDPDLRAAAEEGAPQSGASGAAPSASPQ